MNDKNLTPVLISGVSCYEQDGTAYLKLEDVARGLGFTTVAASGNEVIRWSTVHKYLTELGVATSCNGSDYRSKCPDYIPENIFYRLAMNAKNETAEKFQALVADEIIPSIRKHGAYMTLETLQAAILNPDTMIQLCQQLKAEQDKNAQLNHANRQLLAENSDLKPDAEYARAVCIGDNCRTATSIAKDYGLSGEKLNSILHGLKIQWKNSDGQWVLYSKYCGKGYTRNRKGKPFQHNSGKVQTPNTTVWTEAGQRFIFEQLKRIGLLPSMDPDTQQLELAAQSNRTTAGKLV